MDAEIVEALRAGDEATFAALVAQYGASMLRVAQMYVRSRAVAEEVVQEAWLGVLQGIGRFEGRSSLRTWVLRIVTNIAMTRGAREARTIPFSALGDDAPATVEPERFRDSGEPFPGHWRAFPRNWAALPEEALLGAETMTIVRTAIEELSETQRAVITLRDMLGWTPEEACEALGLGDGNQRVLLHRARARVRTELERHLDG